MNDFFRDMFDEPLSFKLLLKIFGALLAIFVTWTYLVWQQAYQDVFHREPTFAEFVEGVSGTLEKSPSEMLSAVLCIVFGRKQ